MDLRLLQMMLLKVVNEDVMQGKATHLQIAKRLSAETTKDFVRRPSYSKRQGPVNPFSARAETQP